MVSKVRSLGMEVCTTLGMLTADQAAKLKTAGLSCYNHNIDTSPEFYPSITSSRNFEDRLDTLEKVQPESQGAIERQSACVQVSLLCPHRAQSQRVSQQCQSKMWPPSSLTMCVGHTMSYSMYPVVVSAVLILIVSFGVLV